MDSISPHIFPEILWFFSFWVLCFLQALELIEVAFCSFCCGLSCGPSGCLVTPNIGPWLSEGLKRRLLARSLTWSDQGGPMRRNFLCRNWVCVRSLNSDVFSMVLMSSTASPSRESLFTFFRDWPPDLERGSCPPANQFNCLSKGFHPVSLF